MVLRGRFGSLAQFNGRFAAVLESFDVPEMEHAAQTTKVSVEIGRAVLDPESFAEYGRPGAVPCQRPASPECRWHGHQRRAGRFCGGRAGGPVPGPKYLAQISGVYLNGERGYPRG